MNSVKKTKQPSLILKYLTLSAFLVLTAIVIYFSFRLGYFKQSGANYILKKDVVIFSDSEGNPVLAMGNCESDSDCKPSGCSSQICSDHDVVTTCELGQFPEKETYNCGCINDRCVWYR